MGRRPCCAKVGLNRGAWSVREDRILSNYINAHGEGKWRELPQRAGLKRCGKSCRLRWMNYLRPDIKRGNITLEEEDLIIRLHKLLGNRWSLIAGRLPGRTDNEIKNYWQTTLRKRCISSASPDSISSKRRRSPFSTRPIRTKGVRKNCIPVAQQQQDNADHGDSDECNAQVVRPTPRPINCDNGVKSSLTMGLELDEYCTDYFTLDWNTSDPVAQQCDLKLEFLKQTDGDDNGVDYSDDSKGKWTIESEFSLISSDSPGLNGQVSEAMLHDFCCFLNSDDDVWID